MQGSGAALIQHRLCVSKFQGEGLHRPQVVQHGTADGELIFLKPSQAEVEATLVARKRSASMESAELLARNLNYITLPGPQRGSRDCQKDCRSGSRLTSYTADLFPFPIYFLWETSRDRGVRSSLTTPLKEKQRKNTDRCSTERLQKTENTPSSSQ